MAVAGREPVIARDVGGRVARAWLRRSRFADVAALARATLSLGPDASALYHLGFAQSSTGQPWQALTSYQQALNLDPRNDRALTGLAGIYEKLGRPDRALALYERALEVKHDQPEVQARVKELRGRGVSGPHPD